jgi:diguanylate cyclase (GGDEF)-like protein/PAS domain S-box-containing protein
MKITRTPGSDYRALVAVHGDISTVATPEGRFAYVAPSSLRLLGWEPSALQGRPRTDFVHPEDIGVVGRGFASMGSGGLITTTYRFRRRDGRYVWVEDRSRTVVNDGSAVVVSTLRTIDDRDSDDSISISSSTADPLAGLASRSVFMERLGQSIRRLSRAGSVLALIGVDLDRFNRINVSLGHSAGDAVLSQASRRIAACIGPDATLARVAADEFIILIGGLGTEASAKEFCRDVMQAFDSPFHVDGVEVVTTVSVGMTATADPQYSPEGLLREVNLALYRAKELGGNRVEVFDEALRVRAIGDHGMEMLLRSAISDRRIVVEYQPIVEIETGRVRYAEALVRLRDKEHALLLPGSFLGVAADVGLLVALDRLVIERAVTQAAEWREGLAASGFSGVSINLTSTLLTTDGFDDWIIGLLEKHELPARCLHAEITEHELVEATEPVLKCLTALRNAGIRVGLDDFGTGYSSLSSLSHLPVDFVKIDRSFIDSLDTNPGDTAIVAAIIEMSTLLGLDIIAEGVETTTQLRLLHSLGINLAQGYLFAPPGPAQMVDALVFAGSDLLRRPARMGS